MRERDRVRRASAHLLGEVRARYPWTVARGCSFCPGARQAFQEAPGLYPSHITALVEDDLRRMARECGLVDIEVHFTDSGRIPFTAHKWPLMLGARGRIFSDNVWLTAKRPKAS